MISFTRSTFHFCSRGTAKYLILALCSDHEKFLSFLNWAWRGTWYTTCLTFQVSSETCRQHYHGVLSFNNLFNMISVRGSRHIKCFPDRIVRSSIHPYTIPWLEVPEWRSIEACCIHLDHFHLHHGICKEDLLWTLPIIFVFYWILWETSACW